MKRTLFAAILSTFLTTWAGHAEVERGLSFHSYEVRPDQRTSLAIPAGEGDEVRFNRFFTLAFDLKIDTDKECFGYVCRVLVNRSRSIDLLLSNPTKGEPYLGIATAAGELQPLELDEGGVLDRWNRIRLQLVADGRTVRVEANGRPVTAFDSPGREHTVVVLFGANTRETFATSDVAPMAVRSVTLALGEDGDTDYSWNLSSAADLSGNGPGRMAAEVRNPEWLLERHHRWRKVRTFTFDSKPFPVVDPFARRVLFVSAGRVTVFTPHDGRAMEYPFRQNIRPDLITNDFIALPGNRLLYYDFEAARPVVNEFDFSKSDWQRSVTRKAHSKYLHHNKFVNPVDSSIVQLFGYGFHRYLNELAGWKPGRDTVHRLVLSPIEPRYLSAVGIADSVAYIYGGKGNDRGIQEFGTTIYDDFYALDLRDYTLRRIWEKETGEQVAASNLIVAADGTHFLALCYSPNSYQSRLQLTEFAVADGSRRVLADSIPYDFLDIAADAGLLFDPANRSYYAVVSEKAAPDSYRATIYSIRCPVIDSGFEVAGDARRRRWPFVLPVLLLGCGAAFFLWRKRRRSTPPPCPEPVAAALKRHDPGIYLLGGFRVIDRNGQEITSNFTPIMRQLLVLLILFSDRQKGKRGISNAELKEALWSDKSEESFYNNRGVNIRKLRTCLAEVGAVEITSDCGYWYISEGGGMSMVDYFRYNRRLDAIDPKAVSADDVRQLIGIAQHGTLLPDMHFDWADRFKADYTDKVIMLSARIRDNGDFVSLPEICIRLADVTLLFDSLDEDSIRAKCRALIQLKRHGIAENVFHVFCQEYKRLMGEDYRQSFDRFVKGAHSES